MSQGEPQQKDLPFPSRRVPPELRDLSHNTTPEDLFALVGHEIKGPLSVVGSLTEMLSEDWGEITDERRSQVLRRISQATRNLVNTVDSMVQLGSYSDGRVPVTLAVRVVDQVLGSLKSELESLAYPHTLETSVAQDLPPVLVDVDRFRQVLANLVANAAKFSSGESLIRVVAEPDRRADAGVTFKVIDEGVGIPEEERERVFEKFTKLSKGASGLGLGLFVCRALMTSMGGHIWVDATGDQGTTIGLAIRSASS